MSTPAKRAAYAKVAELIEDYLDVLDSDERRSALGAELECMRAANARAASPEPLQPPIRNGVHT